MAIYDVSVPLRPGMPVHPGEPGPALDFRSLISRGDPANVSVLTVGSHSGAHVDAPSHFLDGGTTIDAIPVQALVGPVDVIEHSGSDDITAANIESAGLPPDSSRLLLKTSNGRLWSDNGLRTDFIGLTAGAARWLAERRFVLVGIDYLSVERFDSPDYEVHRTLLHAGIVIVEGLDLRPIVPGRYQLACAPLNVVGAEGAPARVFIWD